MPEPVEPDNTRLFKPDEVALRLGVSRASVYRRIATGELRCVNVSETPGYTRTRVRADDLAAYIERHTQEAVSA